MILSFRYALRSFPLFLLLVFLFGSCSDRNLTETEKSSSEERVLDSASPAPSIVHGLEGALSFDLKMRVQTPEKNKRFKANMRIRPDSAIWGSVAPAFGIEAIRVLLSKDSLHFLDRMNDRYYVGEAERMGSRYGIPLELELFQSMLFGGILLDHPEGFRVFQGGGDSLHYRPVLAPVLSERIGLEDSADPFEGIEMKPRGRVRDSLDLLLEKHGVHPRLPFYWTADSAETLTRATFVDLEERTVLDLSYIERHEFEGRMLPALVKGRVHSSKGISTFELRIQDLESSQELRFPFNVPDGYEPLRP